MNSSNKNSSAKRLTALLDYIKKLERLSRKPFFQVSDHKSFSVYEHKLYGLPGVHLDLQIDDEPVWLKVDRLNPKKPPELPEKLIPFVLVKDDPNLTPVLINKQVSGYSQSGSVDESNITVSTEIHEEFDNYLAQLWQPWAAQEKPRRQTIILYKRLFNLAQSIESEGSETPTELLWGVGIALWNHPKKKIQYPLITQLLELEIDNKTMAIKVQPRNTEPALELHPFYALEIPATARVEKEAKRLLEQLEKLFSPFDPQSFEQILTTTVSLLDSAGQYWPDQEGQTGRTLPSAINRLTITDTWVIFSRDRSNNFLVQDIRHLKEEVEMKPDLQGVARLLVEPVSDSASNREYVRFRGVSSHGFSDNDRVDAPVRMLYFPKPFNQEQVSIIEKLEYSDGVVVQGPPGTGKTHTIANIICYFLAKGKRILVTSRGEPALAVLRDQIPESIRSLTISLLTSERTGLKQLEHAVSKMANEIVSVNTEEVRKEAIDLENKINHLHDRIEGYDREISNWAKKQLTPVPAWLCSGKILPEELARRVQQDRAKYSWFPDPLGSSRDYEPQFTEEDIKELRESRKILGIDIIYLGHNLPAPDTVANTAKILTMHQDLIRLKEIEDEDLPRMVCITHQSITQIEQLLSFVKESQKRRNSLEFSWLKELRTKFYCEATGKNCRDPVVHQLEEVSREIAVLQKLRSKFLTCPVEVPDGSESDKELLEAVRRASSGKRPFGLFSWGSSAVKQRFQKIRVSALEPQNLTQWETVQNFLEFLQKTRSLIARWNALSDEVNGPVVRTFGIAGARELEVIRSKIEDIRQLAYTYDTKLPLLTKELFKEEFDIELLLSRDEELERLVHTLTVYAQRLQLSRAAKDLEIEKEKVLGKPFPVAEEMLDVLSRRVGHPDVQEEVLAGEWDKLASELRRISKLKPYFDSIQNVTKLIENSGSNKWSERLRTVAVTGSDDTELPSDWKNAWDWARQLQYLREIDSREPLKELTGARARAEGILAPCYEELVKHLTWLRLKENMTESVLSALQDYMVAIQRIGKGKGLRSPRYRHDARRAMEKANRAVPCWIMPQWRVSESLPAEIGSFDLVVIDEASQSDIWAIPSLIRGKQVLVVGDDKQVSPTAIGVKEADIKLLKSQYLQDLPFGHLMLPGTSVYDLARVIFAQNTVMLREHFRCVEAIIQFSNQHFYNSEIRPLRVPRASERLVPPLIDIYIKGAERVDKKKINLHEVDAIVSEISKILEHEKYSCRTLGVVSLLGSEQAKLIRQKLIAEIGEDTILKHRILCGDAMTFQGNERDIIFISMIATAEILHSQTSRIFEQRYNVAASRARDRMYLFRSFQKEELKEIDLRLRLLEHFYNPLQDSTPVPASLAQLCETDFERELFDVLKAKGFRVLPKVRVGGYSVPLVVEGRADQRLAIACDGDLNQTLDKWNKSIAQQRVMERMGWNFWRCWLSSFLLDKDACLTDLFATLQKHDIKADRKDINQELMSLVEHRITEVKL